MNLEPISSESLTYQLEEHQLALSQDMTSISPVNELSSEFQENEDSAFSKASTLLINPDEDSDGLDSLAFAAPIEAVPKYYVQGIVMAQRACILTNLPEGESVTVFQPQMVWTIGRNRDAALPLRDRVLSRRHAVILYIPDEGFHFIDLNSMNGSFVNGVRVQQRLLLKDGDRLRLGSFEFSFFTSSQSRSVEAIHPEVLARFTSARVGNFIDYSALEEPEVLFGNRNYGDSD